MYLTYLAQHDYIVLAIRHFALKQGNDMRTVYSKSDEELDLWSDVNNPNNDADMDDWSDAHNPNNDDYLGED